MKVLLSIKPEFVREIFKDEKSLNIGKTCLQNTLLR